MAWRVFQFFPKVKIIEFLFNFHFEFTCHFLFMYIREFILYLCMCVCVCIEHEKTAKIINSFLYTARNTFSRPKRKFVQTLFWQFNRFKCKLWNFERKEEEQNDKHNNNKKKICFLSTIMSYGLCFFLRVHKEPEESFRRTNAKQKKKLCRAAQF